MIQKYTVNGAKLSLGIGARVGLDRAQYKDRAHNLRPTETDGVYEALQPIEFKRGEEIRLSLDGLSRADLTALGLEEKAPVVGAKRASAKRAKPDDDPAKAEV